MARSRNIKPSIMDNDELAALEPLTRLLFVYLWMLADREGRLEDRPARIAAKALPYDRDADVNSMLDDLHTAGFITRYSVNGAALIQIGGFTKHQTPHVREADSELPGPEHGISKVVPSTNQGSASPSPRSPDTGYLIPDTGYLIPSSGQPAMPVAGAVSERFARFWAVYPKKKAKDAALKAFAKRKVDEALLTLMLRAVAVQSASADWQRDEGKFIPYPASWLNAGRWLDDSGPAGGVDAEAARRAASDAEAKRLLGFNQAEVFDA